LETYKKSDFAAHGITDVFVQGIFFALVERHSARATLPKGAQGAGSWYADWRRNLRRLSWISEKDRRAMAIGWQSHSLQQTRRMLYVREVSPTALRHERTSGRFYMTTEEYAPTTKQESAGTTPDLGIDWPVGDPKLSKRDKNCRSLRAADNNFQYDENAAQSDT